MNPSILLTERKTQILQAFVSGASIKEISASLGIQARTVKGHLNRIKEMMGVETRQEMVAQAVALGYVHVVCEVVSPTNFIESFEHGE